MAGNKNIFLALGQVALNRVFGVLTFGGSVFVLFLNELGMPSEQIGLAMSIFPFIGMISIFIAPVIDRWGKKRVFLICYSLRNVAMGMLIAIPFVQSTYGHSGAIVYLFGTLIVFSLLRVFAETAYFPWYQEFIPNEIRGKFSAVSVMLGMLFSVIAVYISGIVVSSGGGPVRYLWLISVGVIIGMIASLLMLGVKGGKPVAAGKYRGANGLIDAISDRNFIYFIVGYVLFTIGSGLTISFIPLFVKNELKVSSGTVVSLDISFMIGGFLFSYFWGWLSDRFGSRPSIVISRIFFLFVPIGWFFIRLIDISYYREVSFFMYFITGAAVQGINISSSRLLFNGVVPRDKGSHYLAVYYTGMGLAGGVSPIISGFVLKLFSDYFHAKQLIDGHGLLFIFSFIVSLCGLHFYRLVRPDGGVKTVDLLLFLLNNSLRWIYFKR